MSAKTDRELLELAAKAAGIRLHVWGTKGDENFADLDSPGERWNPLTDDGDAFRLAVKLQIHATYFPRFGYATAANSEVSKDVYALADEAIFATRHAIVLAAAAIGETL